MWRNVHFWLFYSYLAGTGGPLRQTQGYQIFMTVRSHHRADKCITRTKSNRQFLSYIWALMWKNVHFWLFCSYLGGPGGPLRRTQGYQIFRAVRSHHRADKFITRENNNHQLFIYGPQCEKMRILGYSGGPGWPKNNRTGPILLPSYPLIYINLHIKYGSNPIRFFKVIA